MEELKFRIQRRNNLNQVFFENQPQPRSNANHKYEILCQRKNDEGLVAYAERFMIRFQNGARHETNSILGVLDSDLLEIVRHRLHGFQSGEFASRENAMALTHIEEALMWLAKRADDRDELGVLGKMIK